MPLPCFLSIQIRIQHLFELLKIRFHDLNENGIYFRKLLVCLPYEVDVQRRGVLQIHVLRLQCRRAQNGAERHRGDADALIDISEELQRLRGLRNIAEGVVSEI